MIRSRAVTKRILHPQRPVFFRVCATCSELPFNISIGPRATFYGGKKSAFYVSKFPSREFQEIMAKIIINKDKLFIKQRMIDRNTFSLFSVP